MAALRPDGVCTVSSGNHAQALALAARVHGAPATILMPDDAPAAKLAATEGYGAEVIAFDRYADDREALLAALAAERGLTLVHPYDDPRVMAGAGHRRAGARRRARDLDALLVPVGGGGLLAGRGDRGQGPAPRTRASSASSPRPATTPRARCAPASASASTVPQTIADGQQLPTPGARPFAVIRALVDDVVTVSDAEIVEAMRCSSSA